MARIKIEDLPETGTGAELADEDLENVAGGFGTTIGYVSPTTTYTSPTTLSSYSSIYYQPPPPIPLGMQGSVFGPRG